MSHSVLKLSTTSWSLLLCCWILCKGVWSAGMAAVGRDQGQRDGSQLRALAAFLEDAGSIPGTCTVTDNGGSCPGFLCSLRPLQALHMCDTHV